MCGNNDFLKEDYFGFFSVSLMIFWDWICIILVNPVSRVVLMMVLFDL